MILALDSNWAHLFYYLRGNQLSNQGEYESAIADFERAIQLKPKIGIYHRDRGNSYAKVGNSELAIADFQKVIEIQPRNTSVYLELGQNLSNSRLMVLENAIQIREKNNLSMSINI